MSATEEPKCHYSSQEESSESKNEFPQDKQDSTETENKTEKRAEDEKLTTVENFSTIVANHYNLTPTGFDRRNQSKIYYLRNFNNWIKTILIKENVCALKDYNQRKLTVLDMCCGKGGDLFKWAKLNVRYLVCTDIAEHSLMQYKSRYNDYMTKCQNNNKICNLECEFIPADCTRQCFSRGPDVVKHWRTVMAWQQRFSIRLRGKYHDPSMKFDTVSCQFSFHYCFESLPQAECMLKNASECLKTGGLFIGTLPNANEIVKRLKQSKATSFRNEVFSLEMCSEEPYPLFGAEYNFYLEGVVNCPEFLVHFPTFEKLALKFGLQLVRKEKFTDLFERMKKTREGEILLKKIKALEVYSAAGDRKLIRPESDYLHAKVFCESNNVQRVGTLSKSEWEVISLYQTFVFKKVKTT